MLLSGNLCSKDLLYTGLERCCVTSCYDKPSDRSAQLVYTTNELPMKNNYNRT